MNKNLVNINVHGVLGKKLGQKNWKLSVSSAQEAFHAINTITDSKFRSILNSLSRKGIKYSIKINNDMTLETKEENCNPLNIEYKNLKSVDIAPVIEGAFWGGLTGTSGMLAGAGILAFGGGSNTAKIIGMNLFFAGLANALSEPPDLPEDRQITNPSSDPQALANSYLFNGPANIINEGGPVPLGYGRLMIGSQVVMSTYDIEQKYIDEAGRVI